MVCMPSQSRWRLKLVAQDFLFGRTRVSISTLHIPIQTHLNGSDGTHGHVDQEVRLTVESCVAYIAEFETSWLRREP